MKTYPLSQSQMGIFLEMMQHPQMTQYNLGYIFPLPSHIDLDRLEQALRAIYAARHEWRIRFLMEGDEPRQMVDDSRELKVERLTMTEDQCETYLSEVREPFDPFNDVLCRFWLIELPERKMLVFDFCHLISDGLSLALIFGKTDLPLAYDGASLPEMLYGILSWTEEEGNTFQTPTYEKDKEYYRQHFQGGEALNLAKRNTDPLGRYIRHDEYLPQQEVTDWCKAHGTAPNLLLMAAFAYALTVAGREDNVIFTTVNHGRTKRQMRLAYGMFVRTVPIKATVNAEAKVIDFIQSFRTELTGTIRHGGYPFTHFCRDMQMNPSISFSFQSGEITEDIILEGVSYPALLWKPDTTCGDLSLVIYERDGLYDLRVEASNKLYSTDFLKTVARMIKNVAQQMMTHPDSTLREIEIVSQEDLQELIRLGAGEKRDYDTTRTLVDLFREQVWKTSDAVAVVDTDSQYTYQELDQKSDALACLLIDEGIKPGDHVCVELPRRKEFLLAVFGIMKAGAAYVPIDMEYPEERKRFIIDDSEAKLVINGQWLKANKRTEKIQYPKDKNNVQCSPAYIIYTSGSTGKPKGVVVPHQALSHVVQFLVELYGLTAQSRISCHASFAFDTSMEDLYPVLTVGGTVYIVPEEATKDLNLLHKFLIEHRITGGTFTTQLGQLLLQDYPDLTLDYVEITGEKMTVNPPCKGRLINVYGPTEFTVDATYYELEPERQYDNIPIGRLLPNQTAYIIDKDRRLLPRGMAGELCLAGIQMATGYWKREELTNERFIDIIVDDKPVKVYRTGDLCLWNNEGLLEYLGRIDQQVKLRGFRIELSEIESHALKYDGISQAVATVHDGQLLCLYYVNTEELAINNEQLREFLTKELPDYMIPAAYIPLDEFPLTPNGKVDRKRLPTPDITSDTEYVSPEGEIEKKIAEAFAEVLNLSSPVGALDDFFSLGGDSIKSIRLVSRLRNDDIVTQVSDVMRLKTVRAIAQVAGHSGVTQNQNDVADKDIQRSNTDSIESYIHAAGWTDEQFQTVRKKFEARGEHIERIYPLTYTQRFSLDEIISDLERPVLTLSDRYYLKVAPTREQLEYVTDQLANLHEVLRTAFIYKEVDTPLQAIIKNRRIPLEYFDLTVMEQEDQDVRLKELAFKEANWCVDPENYPLFRIVCAKTSESTSQLFFTNLHIITDGWSDTILMHDFMQLLNEALTGERKMHEGEKGVFEAYVNYVNQACDITEESYWSRFAKGYSNEFVFPLQDKDVQNDNQKVKHEHVAPFSFGKEETERVMQLCSQEGVTVNTLFELAWGLLIQRYNHTNDIMIAKTASGRDHDIHGIENTVGMFIQDVPIRVKTEPEDTPRTLLRKLMLQAAETKKHEHELTSAISIVQELIELYDQRLPIIVFQNYYNSNIEIDNAYFDTIEVNYAYEGGLDIFLYVFLDKTILLFLDYDTTIYPTSDMNRLLDELRNIIRDICEYPDEEWWH